MEDKKITVDGIELIPVWQVLYQDVHAKRNYGKFRILQNPKVTVPANWVAQHTFKSKEYAVDALNALIRERSKGARVETHMCGGFGIDTVIDEDTANDMRIVDWKIRKQYKSKWEIEERMEVAE